MNLCIRFCLAMFCMMALTACPDATKSDNQSSPSMSSSQEVTVQKNLDSCTSEKEGSIVFVRSSDSFYTCDNNVWVPLNLKGEKGDKGDDGAPPPPPVSPCVSITEEALRYGDRIDGSDYSFISMRALPGQKYCLADGQFRWVDFNLSLKLMTSPPAAEIAFEENLCKTAFAMQIIKDYFKWNGGGRNYLMIKNGNMGAKLKRAIICDPDMYGVSTTFPGHY
ncbi:hypothetical protein [Bdellovibrio sp. HCB337]|uniref:hypothetical protein n=1 Tax=Bdellovibrio sp. HCB337 TaxID=3394358 RepID=UPI0039A46338